MAERHGGRTAIQGRQAQRQALSQLELLVVIAIIALLLAVLLPSLSKVRAATRQVLCAQNLRQWANAWQMYRGDYHDYLATEGTYLNMEKPHTWFTVLPPYLGLPPYTEFERRGNQIVELPNIHVWICPEKNLTDLAFSNTGKNQFHYAMNRVLDGTGRDDGGSVTPGFPDMGDDPLPARRFERRVHSTVLMFDTAPNVPHGDPRAAGRVHDRGANVLFLSGTIERFDVTRFVTDGDWENGQIIWDDPKLYWGYTPPEGG
ncbi:MAG: hypothetical protein C4547_02205 [Phycisphaerales bacterium]|nr:MAG: hypothetical protein C4547_02205 [Phycisphaerales bacterium]